MPTMHLEDAERYALPTRGHNHWPFREIRPQQSWPEHCRSVRLAGIKGLSWEDRVDMRIAVPDATSGERLVQRLTSVFDVPSVSLDGGRKEVRVQSEGAGSGSHPSLGRRRWLARARRPRLG